MRACMYVCMFVCLYVCMYVCMYMRMYVCIYVCVYLCMSTYNYLFSSHVDRRDHFFSFWSLSSRDPPEVAEDDLPRMIELMMMLMMMMMTMTMMKKKKMKMEALTLKHTMMNLFVLS